MIFLTAFNALCMCPKIRCDGYCKKFFGTKQGRSIFLILMSEIDPQAADKVNKRLFHSHLIGKKNSK